MRSVGTVLALVVLATVVATFARRWRIPAPSLLVVAGLAVALLPGTPEIRISPQIIGLVVLPPLLYASAEDMPWRELRAVWKPVGILAIGLVLASAAAVAAVAALVTPLSWEMAFVLGAVLASTDPVAVTALGRRLALPPRVQVLVQAESLFNDATSLVLVRVAAGIAIASAAASWGAATGEFFLLAGGGTVIGTAVAAVVTLIRRRTEDPVLETVIALVTPYAAYLLAEVAHTSGVTSCVVAGVVLGGRGDRLTNARIRLQLHAVYGTVVFLLESVVFSLIGLALPSQVRALAHGDRSWPLYALAVAATLVAVRLLWLAPLSAVVQREGGVARLNWRVPMVLTWAGTRGVMPLAAALSIPEVAKNGTPLADRPLVLVLTTSVVVVTLVVQGFTLAPVVRASGIALEPAHTAREEAEARSHLAHAGLARLEELAELEVVPEVVLDRLRRGLTARLDDARDRLSRSDGGVPAESADLVYRQLRRDLIAVESGELQRLYDNHAISDTTRRRLQRALDLEEARLSDV
ncbi:sodium/proton antiporter (CPA1 family) [Streptomyces puniciscabiei]|uniref:Sodium/proton antiporter (CPA1 family) n=1 Tax=Streptomyces puniciscabiei TaxID=164348 RepID=A0A542UET4_9ACTN|nr:Na+/H+ antiporter [Streptomyces puniciscabiei]TQK97572.1 sodium/proton antiporter (CPA1 family) [Streptomyces puniciscabiei]